MLARQKGRRQEELDRVAEDGAKANRNMTIPLSGSVFKDRMFLLPPRKQDVSVMYVPFQYFLTYTHHQFPLKR